MPKTPPPGRGTNARSLKDTVAETGRGLPDDAVGPEQQTIPDQMDLSESKEAQAMAEKLRREAEHFEHTGPRGPKTAEGPKG